MFLHHSVDNVSQKKRSISIVLEIYLMLVQKLYVFLFVLSGYNLFNIYNTIGKSVAEKKKVGCTKYYHQTLHYHQEK